MNEKRESSATIDRKKSIRDAVRVLTIGKNGVAYNNSQFVRGRVSADDSNSIPLGGGEEYFHIGTKSLQFGDADGDARP